MVTKRSVGNTSIGVGGVIFALGVVFILLTYLGYTPNQSWFISWVTNYVVCSVGIVVGLLLLGYGVYTRGVLGTYTRKVERLEQVKAKQAQRLRRKTIELKEQEAELARKQMALHVTKAELRATRAREERKSRQVHRVSGKLGDRAKRLKRIEEIARGKKKPK